jgi:PASTA domain
MIKRARRASLLVVGLCLAAPAFAGASQAESVTVGASLTAPLLRTQVCENPEARGNPGGQKNPEAPEYSCGALTIDAQAPASGAVAVADGTVTTWSVLDADAHPGYSVNVVRKNSNGTYTVTASSAVVTPAESLGVQTFPANLPIHAGEYIELNIGEGGTYALLEGSSEADAFSPGLASGETRTGFKAGNPGPKGGEKIDLVLGYGADIEYTSLVPPAIPPTTSGSGTTSNVVTVAAAPLAASCVVPKLTGKRLKVAKKLIRKAACKVGLVSTKKGVRSAVGKVAKQSPSAGKSVPAHTAISFKLA